MRKGSTLFWGMALLLATTAVGADWPMLHGNAQHTGFIQTELRPPFRLAWAREFVNERIGTAVEPIVGAGRVFISTHAGSVYALSATTGEPIWRFEAHGPVLHSPAFADGLVVVASIDGNVYALDAISGAMRWVRFVHYGGFAASPIVVAGRIFVGAREGGGAGNFVALDLHSGEIVWFARLGAPIRQTAAADDGRIFVTAEDLRVRCFDSRRGSLIWTSEPLPGQTAHDYYPVVAETDGRKFVIVRTNPLLNMGQRIGRDRAMLCRNAGVEDTAWQKVDAWIKSDAALGTPELWNQEQAAIRAYLGTNETARSFFVLEAATGKQVSTAPVLWVGGCQSVGAMPALTENGAWLTCYRSAYGNWNHGVAPLVALGLFNVGANRITPLFHQQGRQPPWNCFWGTADESQNFVVIGRTVLIVHQGTLSGFDLKEDRLFPLYGERDTYGGFRSPPWARNEWHGPARSGVAVEENRLYWQTGSRVLCLASDDSGKAAEIIPIEAKYVVTHIAPEQHSPIRSAPNRLDMAVKEMLTQSWAPLFVEPGLAGRNFSFDHSGEVFEALAWAWPHLRGELAERTRKQLAEEWHSHPPFAQAGAYPLRDGAPREWFQVPNEYRARSGNDKRPHPFGNMHVVWLYAERCNEADRVLADWPKLKEAYVDFSKLNWRLDPAKGDLFANRYLASLIAFARLAEKAGDNRLAAEANTKADETAGALVQWWKRAAEHGTLQEFKGSGELDPFIGKGDGLSFAVTPHRHKVALFQDLTPEVAALIKTKAPDAVTKVWEKFSGLYRTWALVGEERQVHFGENFVDPPDLALGGFKALAWLRNGSGEELKKNVDLPICRADLYYITKLAMTLEAR